MCDICDTLRHFATLGPLINNYAPFKSAQTWRTPSRSFRTVFAACAELRVYAVRSFAGRVPERGYEKYCPKCKFVIHQIRLRLESRHKLQVTDHDSACVFVDILKDSEPQHLIDIACVSLALDRLT